MGMSTIISRRKIQAAPPYRATAGYEPVKVVTNQKATAPTTEMPP